MSMVACLQMLTISSKYLLVNASGDPLHFAQHATTCIWQLQPDCVAPFHWTDTAERFELCVRPALGSWTWSGAFKVIPHPAQCPWSENLKRCLTAELISA